jgi:hypothetical protein
MGPICIHSGSLKTLEIEFLFRNTNMKQTIDKMCMLQLNTPNVNDLCIKKWVQS